MRALVRRLVAIVAVASTLVALATACSRGKVEGEGRLDPNGRVLLTRDDKVTTVAGSRSLATGDTVEVAEGTARITLPGGDVLELRPRTVLVLARGPELRRGNLLVTANGAPRTVRASGSQVDASGATRIDVTLTLRVVAYGGRAIVRSGGRTVEVPALREASVPVTGIVRPRPLAIDGDDPWDQQLLGDVATKEPEVESRARGFSGQVAPSDAGSVAYYRSLLPGLNGEPAFQQADVDRLGRGTADAAMAAGQRFRAGDVLLGSAIALQGRRGTFAERLAGAAAFRAEGASWSLVSLDQQVPSIDALLKLVDDAVNVAPLELAAPGPPVAAAVAAEPPPAAPANPSPSRPTATPTRPTTRTTPSPPTSTAPPPPQAQPQPQPQPPTWDQQPRPAPLLPIDPLIDPVVNLLDDLLDG